MRVAHWTSSLVMYRRASLPPGDHPGNYGMCFPPLPGIMCLAQCFTNLKRAVSTVSSTEHTLFCVIVKVINVGQGCLVSIDTHVFYIYL